MLKKPESLDELECLTNTIQWLLNYNEDFLLVFSTPVSLSYAHPGYMCDCYSLFQVKDVPQK